MSADIRSHFRIRQFREASNETQEQLAIALGVSYSTVKSWERCASAPKADAVVAMCEHFGTDPNTLLGWYDEHPEDRPSSSVTREESTLLSNYRASPPEGSSTITAVAQMACGQSQEGHDASSEAEAV